MQINGTTAGGRDPLPIDSTDVSFEGVVHALEQHVERSTWDWADRHVADRPGGWEMHLELVRAGSNVGEGQVTVELDARVTLRGAAGHEHLGQTTGHCKQTELATTSEQIGAVAHLCMEHLARDLAGWLEGVKP
jgi:hypothetical protein